MVQLVIMALLQYGPSAAIAIKSLLETENPSQGQWDAVFELATQKNYDAYLEAARAKAGLIP